MSDSPSPYQVPQSGMSAPPAGAIAPKTTSIPKVFGIINICYAGLGMIGAVFSVGSFFLMKTLLSKAGDEVQELETFTEAYSTMAIYTYIDAGIKVVLGIMLLVAGVGLLKKKLWAQKMSVTWAVLRIIITVVMTIVTYGASLELQEAMGEVTKDQPGAIDQTKLKSSIQGVSSVFNVIFLCIYPVLTIIFLSKKVVKDSLR